MLMIHLIGGLLPPAGLSYQALLWWQALHVDKRQVVLMLSVFAGLYRQIKPTQLLALQLPV